MNRRGVLPGRSDSDPNEEFADAESNPSRLNQGSTISSDDETFQSPRSNISRLSFEASFGSGRLMSVPSGGSEGSSRPPIKKEALGARQYSIKSEGSGGVDPSQLPFVGGRPNFRTYRQPSWAEPWPSYGSLNISRDLRRSEDVLNAGQSEAGYIPAYHGSGMEPYNPRAATPPFPGGVVPGETESPTNAAYRRWVAGGRGFPPPGSDPAAQPLYPNIDHTNEEHFRGPLQSGRGSGYGAPGFAERPHSMPNIRTSMRTSLLPIENPMAAAAPNPVAGEAVKMGKRAAWLRYLAYEASFQSCLSAHLASTPDNHGMHFLADGCALLKKAYQLEALTLERTGPSAEGPTSILWDDSEAAEAVVPSVGFAPETRSAASVKATAVQLVPSEQYKAAWWKRNQPDQLYVCLHPANRLGDEGAWTIINKTFKGKNGDVCELGPAELNDNLVVEVHNYEGVIAQGMVPVSDLWQAAQKFQSIDMEPRRQTWLNTICPCKKKDDDEIFGKKFVQVYDAGGQRYGLVLLATWISSEETTIVRQVPLSGAAAPAGIISDGGTGYQQITSWQVYDLALESGLRAQECGPRRLSVTGEWSWLLKELAGGYGIRPSYTVLAHLRWLMRPPNATCHADCLELLGSELAPLKLAEVEGRLLPQELAIMARIENAVEALLASCFENYYALSEAAPSGILDGGMAAAEFNSGALLHAVELCGILRDVLRPTDQAWLTERFQNAACKRYVMLEGACNERVTLDGRGNLTNRGQAPQPANQHRPIQVAPADAAGPLSNGISSHQAQYEPPPPPDPSAELAYARLEALCQAIKNELQMDLRIHDSAILPAFITLPQVTAYEYCREFVGKLVRVLANHPSPEPTRPAVDLLVTVGQWQEYMAWHNLLPPPGHPGTLDALAVFGPHVHRWIDNSQDVLCHRCNQLEANTFALAAVDNAPEGAGRAQVAPLVNEMLARLSGEVARYERVIVYWPVFGPFLETAVCSVLRATTAAVSRQCGLVQAQKGGAYDENPYAPPGHGHQKRGSNNPMFGKGSPTRWKWQPTAQLGPSSQRVSIMAHEAVLLNSLRRLLSVVPQTETTIARWAAGSNMPPPAAATPSPQPPHSPGGGQNSPGRAPDDEAFHNDGTDLVPHLGAQFAQQVKELRSEYAAAVTACAERIAGAVFVGQRSILGVLQRCGLQAVPVSVQPQIEPALLAVEDVLSGLNRVLDGRVFVALGRGLWDCTSKQIYDYVDSLQEGKENKGAWRGRQHAAAALDVVDNFFTAVLSATMQHDLQSKDLDLPLHSDRCHKLLAENTAAVNMSYTVY